MTVDQGIWGQDFMLWDHTDYRNRRDKRVFP